MSIIKLYRDGDMFCVLSGPNIMEGTAGYGKTPDEALEDFVMVSGDGCFVTWDDITPVCNSYPCAEQLIEKED